MRVACHQFNFCPWFPFFYKMAMVDKFVLMRHVQFEKNGFQNRYKLSNGKWVTKPVRKGLETLANKDYVGMEDRKYWFDRSLVNLNKKWIEVIKDTLDIQTTLVEDDEFLRNSKGMDPTRRIIAMVKAAGGTTYVTNPEAKDKYLDEGMVKAAGIDIDYCVVPRNLKKHTFEIFEEYGIEGAVKQLPKEALCKV